MKSLKLNNIESNRLEKHEMKNLFGGNTCDCACKYATQGGSSYCDNSTANFLGNKTSPGVTPTTVATLEEYKFWTACYEPKK